ncbi:sodium-dependent lysophosphatidylcholine symporter 1-B-like, partial [Lates calcarifer]|uniref:Sodium-dependent lysophosphatidylcholine symporter 1-B-like n=1 Tax=Lates calcarifer TaxID=8187 RepID=A0AAJ7PKY5_LATCA
FLPCSSPWSPQAPGGISLARKICYAVGGVPYQMTALSIGISLQIFLLDIVQMEAFYVSMILFLSQAWDAVTDPVVGYLVSRSKWTRIGKLTPWLVLSTPFGVLSYLLLWFEPHHISQPLRVLWFLAASCLFETLMSCYNIPYLSLNMFLGGDQKDRDSATAYRMSAELVSMLLASVIQGQVMALYNTERQESCQPLDPVHETPESTSPPQTASLQETKKAFLISALVMGALFFLCSLVVFLGVKEQQGPLCSDDKVQPPYLISLKMLICHIPYQRLVLGFIFAGFAFQMSWSNLALYCSHVAGLGAQLQYLLLISASVAVPLWQAVLLRLGKKVTIFIGLSLYIPAVIIVACVPSNLPVLLLMGILMGFSMATVFFLPWSMLPDAVDDFAMRHPSCKDLEPLFFSCYAFCRKLAGGLSVGISTMILHFVGYRAGACSHGDGVVTTLIVLFSPAPIALLLIGMAFFCCYPINERQSLQLQEQLTPVNPEASSSSSSSEPGENTEKPTVLQSSQAAVTSTSHYTTLHKSNSAPSCCYSRDKRCSVNLSALSDVPKSLSVKYSRPKSVVQLNVNPQWQKQRLSHHQPSGEAGLSRNVLENNPRSLSSRTNVKSKLSWV